MQPPPARAGVGSLAWRPNPTNSPLQHGLHRRVVARLVAAGLGFRLQRLPANIASFGSRLQNFGKPEIVGVVAEVPRAPKVVAQANN